MTLTDEDWNRLKLLQARLGSIPKTSRKSLLHKIVGPKCENTPFAEIIEIQGHREFFEALDHLWQAVQDEGFIHKYIQALEPLTINSSDGLWIRELIDRLKHVPPPPKETDLLTTAVGGVLKRNRVLGEKLLEATRHVDSVSLPHGIRTQEELVSQFLKNEFPLMCLRGTLDACVDRQMQFEDPSTKKDLIVLKDVFTVASFPGDDKRKIVGAMQAAWDKTEPEEGAELETSSKDFAEDLLISAWLQITNQKLEDWEVLKLLHRDPNYPLNAKERKSVMFRRVHVLSQPAVQPTGDTIVYEYAKSCLCEVTGKDQNPTDPIKMFNLLLDKLEKTKAVAALFITKEFKETISVLKKHFPRLILVILSATDADRYSSIYTEISFIDGNIDRICRS